MYIHTYVCTYICTTNTISIYVQSVLLIRGTHSTGFCNIRELRMDWVECMYVLTRVLYLPNKLNCI